MCCSTPGHLHVAEYYMQLSKEELVKGPGSEAMALAIWWTKQKWHAYLCPKTLKYISKWKVRSWVPWDFKDHVASLQNILNLPTIYYKRRWTFTNYLKTFITVWRVYYLEGKLSNVKWMARSWVNGKKLSTRKQILTGMADRGKKVAEGLAQNLMSLSQA